MSDSPENTSLAARVRKFKSQGFGSLATNATKAWVARVILFDEMRQYAQAHIAKLFADSLPAITDLRAYSSRTLPVPRENEARRNFQTNGPLALPIEEETQQGTQYSIGYLESWAVLEKAASTIPAAGDLKAGMMCSAKKWRLDQPWFLSAALLNLTIIRTPEFWQYWAYDVNLISQGGRTWGPGLPWEGQRNKPSWTPPFRILPPEVPPYIPLMETRKQYLDRQKKKLEKYCEQVENGLKAFPNISEAVAKRARCGAAWNEARWFVLNRICFTPQAEIAELENVENPETISGRINEFRRLLDLVP